jgi:hypothetical protein
MSMEGPINSSTESIVEDTYHEICERLKFAKKEIERLEGSEEKEQLDSYKAAAAKLQEKRDKIEDEWDKTESLRSVANKVFNFSNPKEIVEWKAIQTDDWMSIGKNIEEARSQKNTEQIIENLNIWAELLKKKSGTKEPGDIKMLKQTMLGSIQTFLKTIEEYQSKGIPVPWDQVRNKI